MAKIRNFHSFAPINVKFGSPMPNFTFIGATCQPIFGPLSKNNTGMAVLRAGLRVIIINN